jgi:hypothetical protein
MNKPVDPNLNRTRDLMLPDAVPTVSEDDLRILTYQMEVMQKRLRELEYRKDFEAKVETLAARWEDFFTEAELRFEKVQSHLQKQHESYRIQFRDMQSKVAKIIGWANERKKVDGSWYELVEQQQQTLQSIEARMQQWQKLVSDQELQKLNSNSDKIRMEKLQSHWQRQNESLQTAIQEIRATLVPTGHPTEAAAVSEMIDRQRRLVQSFELRLRQAEKVISEQALQLSNARAELKEALRNR